VNGLQFAAAVISSLVWPAVVVGFIVGFRKQFKTVFEKLTNRLKKISGGGFEAEFLDAKLEWGAERLATSLGATFEPGAHDPARHGSAGPDLLDLFPLPHVYRGTPTKITDVDTNRDTEHDKPRQIQLDPQVRVHLAKAIHVVESEPREGVLNAGIALERSITTTLELLGIPHGVDARGPRTYLPPISALLQAGIVGRPQAKTLDRLIRLYRSAVKDSANEITPFSALDYVLLVQKEVEMLALQRDACVGAQTAPSRIDDDSG